MRYIISEDGSWLNKGKKAIYLHLTGEMKGTRKKGMRTPEGQKQQEWSTVRWRQEDRSHEPVSTRPGTHNQMPWVWPIFRRGSPEPLRGIYHQFRISNIRLGMKWTWVDGLDPVLNTGFMSRHSSKGLFCLKFGSTGVLFCSSTLLVLPGLEFMGLRLIK